MQLSLTIGAASPVELPVNEHDGGTPYSPETEVFDGATPAAPETTTLDGGAP